MNCSGPPVKGLLREFGIPPSEIIVVHDDLDLEPGRLRIKLSGGYGGHNGIKSLIEALGTPQFIRLKIGVGRPAPGQDSADYVLEPVTKDELAIFEPCLEQAVDALECLIHRGPEVAMNQFNVRERVEKGEQPD
jgi:PTH1 family peptidyl-tRNA hydrolase